MTTSEAEWYRIVGFSAEELARRGLSVREYHGCAHSGKIVHCSSLPWEGHQLVPMTEDEVVVARLEGRADDQYRG